METKYNPVIANNAKYSETNYRTSVTDYDTWPRNDEFILERSRGHVGASNQSKTIQSVTATCITNCIPRNNQ